MKSVLFLLAVAVAFPCAAAQLFHAKPKGSDWVCSDKTVIAEIYDLTMHDPNNPQITELAQQGNCTPILINFSVIKLETLQVPAGPQKIAEVSIPNTINPAMPPDTGWMMEADIEPVKN